MYLCSKSCKKISAWNLWVLYKANALIMYAFSITLHLLLERRHMAVQILYWRKGWTISCRSKWYLFWGIQAWGFYPRQWFRWNQKKVNRREWNYHKQHKWQSNRWTFTVWRSIRGEIVIPWYRYCIWWIDWEGVRR